MVRRFLEVIRKTCRERGEAQSNAPFLPVSPWQAFVNPLTNPFEASKLLLTIVILWSPADECAFADATGKQ